MSTWVLVLQSVVLAIQATCFVALTVAINKLLEAECHRREMEARPREHRP